MLLIARGAYIEQKDKHGKTVVDWMKQLGGQDELAAEVKDIAALRKVRRRRGGGEEKKRRFGGRGRGEGGRGRGEGGKGRGERRRGWAREREMWRG